jgi:mRNA interferase MazF
MVKNKYIPERGDLVWLNFDPTKGHEQKGRRPSVVLSPIEYNCKSTLAIFCPITSVSKEYPYEVEIEKNKIEGFALVDQMKNFDWSKRDIEFISRLNKENLKKIIQKAITLIN